LKWRIAVVVAEGICEERVVCRAELSEVAVAVAVGGVVEYEQIALVACLAVLNARSAYHSDVLALDEWEIRRGVECPGEVGDTEYREVIAVYGVYVVRSLSCLLREQGIETLGCMR
jgi:hypothetical protein